MNVATGSFRPLDEPANTSILVYFAILHMAQLQRPVGGAGGFTQALASCVQALGGEVRTSSPVDQVVVHNGKVRGVALKDGKQLHAEQVIAAIDPTPLFRDLLPAEAISSDLREEVGRMRVLSSGVSHFKADLAVTRRPTFPGHTVSDEQLAGLSFAPTVDYINRVMSAIRRGELADELPFYIAVPSVLDRTLVPADSSGDSIAVWVGAVPYDLSDGREWADVKQGFLDRVVDHLEEYSPGVRDTIIGANIRSPRDFNQPWAYKGSSRSVDLVPSQMGPWRPSPSLVGLRHPDPRPVALWAWHPPHVGELWLARTYRRQDHAQARTPSAARWASRASQRIGVEQRNDAARLHLVAKRRGAAGEPGTAQAWGLGLGIGGQLPRHARDCRRFRRKLRPRTAQGLHVAR